jgi:hypothetical protein
MIARSKVGLNELAPVGGWPAGGRRRTFSVSAARSAKVIGRAGNCLRQAACPQEGRRPVTGRHEDAVGHARMEMHVVIERRSEALQDGQTPRPLHEQATTKPCPHEAQRARPHPKQRMPPVRYDRRDFDDILRQS